MDFRWNTWNRDHVRKHGVEPDEAEAAVRSALPPYPLRREDDKWLVWSRGQGGRLVQVVFVLDDDDSIFIIHARPLTDREKHRFRIRRRR